MLQNFKLENVDAYVEEKGMKHMGIEALVALLHATSLFLYSFGRHEIAVHKEQEAIAFANRSDKESEQYSEIVTKIGAKLTTLETKLKDQKESYD